MLEHPDFAAALTRGVRDLATVGMQARVAEPAGGKAGRLRRPTLGGDPPELARILEWSRCADEEDMPSVSRPVDAAKAWNAVRRSDPHNLAGCTTGGRHDLDRRRADRLPECQPAPVARHSDIP